MAKGIKRQLRKVIDNITEELKPRSQSDNMYRRGLSTEGYQGGYRDALYDVQLALEGNKPNRRGWWSDAD